MKSRAREQRARQDLAYREEQVRMMHTLHDSVAGTLTYAILRCRRMRHDRAVNGECVDDIEEVERIVSLALREMRTKVIEPVSRVTLSGDAVLGAAGIVCETPHQDVTDPFQEKLLSIDERLRNLGFIGAPLLRGDYSVIIGGDREFLLSVIDELFTNMAKYGIPDHYAFMVSCGGGEFSVLTSNRYDVSTENHGRESSSHAGLALLRNSIEQRNGTVSINTDAAEWTVNVTVPV